MVTNLVNKVRLIEETQSDSVVNVCQIAPLVGDTRERTANTVARGEAEKS